MIKKIAILTSGGDSQGMNALIFNIINMANIYKIETYIIKNGYCGLFNNWINKTNIWFNKNISNTGGSILGCARFPDFKNINICKISADNLKKHDINVLIVIGGDGSFKGIKKLIDIGVNCIGIPGTIDNDVAFTEHTIGFDTTINIVVDAIDRIRDTAESHNRCIIIEVMGRYCGDIALYSGIAGGADIISIYEIPLTVDEIIDRVKIMFNKNKRSIIIVVSEMIYPNIHELAKNIEKNSGYITRATVLGYIQRGGKPTAIERYRAFQMAQYVIDKLIKNKYNIIIGNIGDKIISCPIIKALNKTKKNHENIWKKFDKLKYFDLYKKKTK